MYWVNEVRKGFNCPMFHLQHYNATLAAVPSHPNSQVGIDHTYYPSIQCTEQLTCGEDPSKVSNWQSQDKGDLPRHRHRDLLQSPIRTTMDSFQLDHSVHSLPLFGVCGQTGDG